jgi:hypothetical protein
MKPIITILLFVGSLADLGAQGTVRFTNSSADFTSPPDRLVRFDPVTVGTNPQFNPYGTNNAPVVNVGSSVYFAQLYYGPSIATEGSLIAVSAAPAFFRPSTTTGEPGTWSPGTRTLDGFPDGPVSLQVRVWDGQYASSWEAASALGQNYRGLLGESLVFQYVIPTDPLANLDTFTMRNFEGFTIGIVPEPKSASLLIITLCFVGLVAFQHEHSKEAKPAFEDNHAANRKRRIPARVCGEWACPEV